MNTQAVDSRLRMLLLASFRPLPDAQASTSDSVNCRGWCLPLVSNSDVRSVTYSRRVLSLL